VRELRPWLHKILHNTALNALRVSGYDHEDLREALSIADAPQEELERRMVMRRTLAGLAALPERQREALRRTAVEGRSQGEVAEALGLSQGALRQLVHRARTSLRAAATALTPLPIATWLATAGTRAEPIAGRISELAAGAGSAGASATLAKAGVVGVLAGGAALGGPALVQREHPRGAPHEEAVATATPQRARRAESTAAPVKPVAAQRTAVVPVAAVAAPRRRRSDEGTHSRHHAQRAQVVPVSSRRGSGEDRGDGGGDDEQERGSPAPSGSRERQGEDQTERRSGGGGGDDHEGQAPAPVVAAATPTSSSDDERSSGGEAESDHSGGGSAHHDD
jgi:hypothetical protein